MTECEGDMECVCYLHHEDNVIEDGLCGIARRDALLAQKDAEIVRLRGVLSRIAHFKVNDKTDAWDVRQMAEAALARSDSRSSAGTGGAPVRPSKPNEVGVAAKEDGSDLTPKAEDTTSPLTPPRKIEAPWTEEQVASLREIQAWPFVHPFTGTNRRGEKVVLIPTKDGWIAEPGGPIVQTWAHESMLRFGRPPRQPL